MRKSARRLGFVSFLGPGLLAALADNDAGGVIAYVVTGATFGYGLFLPLLCGMLLLTYTVQELAMRLGAVSGEGFVQLVRRRYGRFWMGYQLISLLIENVLTLMTEFIGMAAGLMLLGLPLWTAVVIGTVLVLSLTFIHGYARKEKVAIFVGLLNAVFLGIALWMGPDWLSVGQSFLPWHWDWSPGWSIGWYAAAMVGNAVAPWMLFYQNSAYAQQGQGDAVRRGRFDTVVGCICQLTIAFALVIIGVLLSGALPDPAAAGPEQLLAVLADRYGGWLSLLFGLGLFNAGLLAAATVSLSSAWSAAQGFGWSKSPDDTLREAPGFYGIYWGSVLLAAGLVLLPGLPLNQVAVVTQVLSGMLMVPVLFFLMRFTSDSKIMGDRRNTLPQKLRGWFAAAVLAIMSAAAVVLLFF